MFSPVDPHLLYYAANVLFKTSDGGKTWQTDQPRSDARASGPAGIAGAAAAEGCRPSGAARSTRWRHRSRTSTRSGRAPTTACSGSRATAARTGRTSRRRPTDAVEQGHADQRLAFRRRHRLCLGQPLPHRRSAPVHLSARTTAARHGSRSPRDCPTTAPVEHRARRSGPQGPAVCRHRDQRLGVARRWRSLAVAATRICRTPPCAICGSRATT